MVEYNCDWPKQFEKEKNLLLRALRNTTIEIEHIGSTSVESLVAKPIIDIMVGLHDFSYLDSFIPKIVNLGYIYFSQFEDVLPNRRFFKKFANGKITHHIHMVEVNSDFWKRHLLFRDYLRRNPETKEDYATLKKELAKQDWKESNDFSDAKTEFIRTVEQQAKKANK